MNFVINDLLGLFLITESCIEFFSRLRSCLVICPERVYFFFVVSDTGKIN